MLENLEGKDFAKHLQAEDARIKQIVAREINSAKVK